MQLTHGYDFWVSKPFAKMPRFGDSVNITVNFLFKDNASFFPS